MKETIFPQITKLSGPPEIRKNGIIAERGSEMSLFLYHGRLMYLENRWNGYGSLPGPCAIIADYFTHECYAPVGGDGGRFYSAYSENDVVYVFSTVENRVLRYVSEDLEHWTAGEVVLTFPDNFTLFNTAVCRDADGYCMAIEGGYAKDGDGNDLPNEYIGIPFTEFFAKSTNLVNWTLLPFEKSYTKERYCACPALKFCEGYYYMICLEALPAARYAPYIYRTQDFETWEIGYYNPLFVPGREDLSPKVGFTLSLALQEQNFQHLNTNNSDIDLLEYEGRTYIVYCSGNQGNTWGGLYCEAVYDGPLDAFLKSNFS